MEFEDLSIPGLVLVQLRTNGDARGFFVERFKRSVFEAYGIATDRSEEHTSELQSH